jgi:hypothetical protein
MIDERIGVFGGMRIGGTHRSTLGEYLHMCHFIHHKYHMKKPGIEPAPHW